MKKLIMSQNPEQTIAELQQKIKSLELQLKKAKNSSGYGLKREEKPEIFEERAQNALPVLKEDKDLLIDNKSDLDHIIIEGDNYHALSALNYTHKGKIDLIYIDPPYNTGNEDFIYNDKYLNPDDAYRHSTWLSFMNKRLRLAKNLLSDTGVIFISIDDNEQANLKLLCDDIFSEENFVANIVWQTRFSPISLTKNISKMHEYVLIYAKNQTNLSLNDLPRSEKQNKRYKNIDNDPRGPWTSGDCTCGPLILEKTYELTTPSGRVVKPAEGLSRMFTKKRMQEMIDDNRIRFGEKGDNMPRYKRFLSEVRDGVVPTTFRGYEETGGSQGATREMIDIFGGKKYFDYPKPVNLIKQIITIGTKNGIILDFFAGSGTTGQAVIELNKKDGGHRKFILCSNRENTEEKPDKNICKNVTYERVKRIMQGYTNGKKEKVEGLYGGNLRYYTTEFIKKQKSNDDLRQSFIYLCNELLCIKEDTFNGYKSELLSDKLKCYYKNDHYTVILYDIREMENLQNLISKLDGQISVYIFSLSGDGCEEELQEFSDKITIENIPDDILETYKKIF